MGSILHEIGPIIDDFFGAGAFGKSPHYRHKQSCLKLSENPLRDANSASLISDICEKIESNWRRSQEKKRRNASKQNWRFVPRPKFDEDNPSLEVTLERRIIQSSDESWANQIPTSSGLTGPNFDKARNIDLVHKLGSGQCEFIELKVNSDTPFYAAMEILTYGCLYLFSCQHRDELGYDNSKELLNLSSIHLRVLAPRLYYAPDRHQPGRLYNLKWLEELVNDGLRQYVEGLAYLDLTMDFRFDAFPADFTWTPSREDTSDETLQTALENRRPVYLRS